MILYLKLHRKKTKHRYIKILIKLIVTYIYIKFLMINPLIFLNKNNYYNIKITKTTQFCVFNTNIIV